MIVFLRCSVLAALSTLSFTGSRADVTLPALFSDHMVLQRSDHVPVWGRAAAGEHITIKLGGTEAQTDAGPDGNWRIKLDLHDQPSTSTVMTVQGNNLLTLQDVVVGEVWLCGGQSNMEMTLNRTIGATEEIAASANPQIRMFRVKGAFALQPASDCDGKWFVAGPTTSGGFTAVGYYFAKHVQQSLGGPIGILNDNYGGSVIEAWMNQTTIDQDPALKTTAEELLADAQAYPAMLKTFQDKYATWSALYRRADQVTPHPEIFSNPDSSTAGWKPVHLPGTFAAQGLPDAGAVWVRQTIDVSATLTTSYLPLHLDGIHDFDRVYWNGREIGSTTADQTKSYNDGVKSSLRRRYDVPQAAVKAGPSVLAIRVFAPAGSAGIGGKIEGNGIRITSDWLAKAEFALPPLSEAAQADYPHEPAFLGGERNMPTELYNGMLHPVIPYALRGFLWYQGESNVGRAVQYKAELPELIKNWRNEWGEGDVPFYFCQLANYMGKKPQPMESAWAEMREATTQATATPQTGQAVLIDLGEAADIHYRNKKDAGDRLALLALARTYGQAVADSGPVFASSAVEGDKVRIRFQHVDGGLVAKALPASYQPTTLLPQTEPLVRNSPNSQLEGFQICGADHKWVWADASIDGQTVLVSSASVPEPVAVRYAWADNPTCNLYNAAGLPAGPFRTDDFPLQTEKNKY